MLGGSHISIFVRNASWEGVAITSYDVLKFRKVIEFESHVLRFTSLIFI